MKHAVQPLLFLKYIHRTQFQQNVNEKPANKPISAIEFDVEKSMRISKHYII